MAKITLIEPDDPVAIIEVTRKEWNALVEMTEAKWDDKTMYEFRTANPNSYSVLDEIHRKGRL